MRASGILLPVFSLPGDYGIGSMSEEAYKFIDCLSEARQTYWQILPIGPTSYGDSPYQSFSTFAGNPYFIDLKQLVKEGLLTKKECDAVDFGNDPCRIDYEKLYLGRYKLLKKAYERAKVYEDPDFKAFCKENEYWIHDYALFMALKDYFDGVSFREWPEDIRRRYQYALDYYGRKLYYEKEFYEYLQYEFYKQWNKLKAYANKKGIRIIGDIPIYVSEDSSDVWSHPDLFQLDENGEPKAVAGCPPDGFSADGQLWGNPLYDWGHHQWTGYDWWCRRMEKCRELYDVVRIDHFRGFDEYYSIPFGDKTAVNGHWEKGPGMDLFNTINWRLGQVNVIAEDLGFITDSVRALVRDSGFPNMKVLEFAFDSRDSSGPIEYLPHNYAKNCVVYTGTHDNETIMGWLNSILPMEIDMVKEYTGIVSEDHRVLAERLIRLAQSSTADTCIIPLQDYLYLDNKARINKPSTVGENWVWRADAEMFSEELKKRLKKLTLLYGRAYE